MFFGERALMSAEPSPPGASAFPVTMWSRVLRTRDDVQSRAALEELCAAYREPVLNFVRLLGCGEDSEDITQEFFTHFLRREGFQRAEPELGRLRSYLKSAVRNHVSHWWRARRALRRGSGEEALSLDAENAPEFPAPPDADTRYDQEWAHTILSRALNKLRDGYVQRGREAVYESIKPALLGDATVDRSLAVEQHRARRRLADLLRHEVADTVDDPAEVEAELHHLLRVLAEHPVAP